MRTREQGGTLYLCVITAKSHLFGQFLNRLMQVFSATTMQKNLTVKQWVHVILLNEPPILKDGLEMLHYCSGTMVQVSRTSCRRAFCIVRRYIYMRCVHTRIYAHHLGNKRHFANLRGHVWLPETTGRVVQLYSNECKQNLFHTFLCVELADLTTKNLQIRESSCRINKQCTKRRNRLLKFKV